MGKYNHILIAVDLTNEGKQVVARASEIAKPQGAQLSLVHAIEPLSYAYGGDIPMDLTGIQEEIEQQAKLKLAALAESMGIPKERQHIVYGRPEVEIHKLSKKQDIDLIVIGSHGRHGFQLLLGSTANAVLHGASCDILAVRVRPETD